MTRGVQSRNAGACCLWSPVMVAAPLEMRNMLIKIAVNIDQD